MSSLFIKAGSRLSSCMQADRRRLIQADRQRLHLLIRGDDEAVVLHAGLGSGPGVNLADSLRAAIGKRNDELFGHLSAEAVDHGVSTAGTGIVR